MAEKVAETWITTPKRLLSAANREACLVHIYPTGPTMGCRYPLADRPLDARPRRGLRHPHPRPLRLAPARPHRAGRRRVTTSPTCRAPTARSSTTSNSTTRWLLQDGDYLRVGNCIYRFLAGGNIEAEYHEEIYRLTILDGLTADPQPAVPDRVPRPRGGPVAAARPAAVGADVRHRPVQGDQRHLGHLCGDFVLRELADVIRGTRPQGRPVRPLRRRGVRRSCWSRRPARRPCWWPSGSARRSPTHPFRFEATPVNLTISIGVASTTRRHDRDASEPAPQAADEKLVPGRSAPGANRVSACSGSRAARR